MSTMYRSTRIAQEHHVAGKGNTTMSHNLDDRKQRAILATDAEEDELEKQRCMEAFRRSAAKRFKNLYR